MFPSNNLSLSLGVSVPASVCNTGCKFTLDVRCARNSPDFTATMSCERGKVKRLEGGFEGDDGPTTGFVERSAKVRERASSDLRAQKEGVSRHSATVSQQSVGRFLGGKKARLTGSRRLHCCI